MHMWVRGAQGVPRRSQGASRGPRRAQGLSGDPQVPFQIVFWGGSNGWLRPAFCLLFRVSAGFLLSSLRVQCFSYTRLGSFLERPARKNTREENPSGMFFLMCWYLRPCGGVIEDQPSARVFMHFRPLNLEVACRQNVKCQSYQAPNVQLNKINVFRIRVFPRLYHIC